MASHVVRRLSNSVPKGASLTVTTTRRLSSSTLSPELLGGERRASAGSLTAPALLAGPVAGPGITPTPTNTPANMNELLAPPPMPRRASTYHDTEKANSGELDNSGGSAAAPKTSREGTLRFPRRRLPDGVTRATTQVDRKE